MTYLPPSSINALSAAADSLAGQSTGPIDVSIQAMQAAARLSGGAMGRHLSETPPADAKSSSKPAPVAIIQSGVVPFRVDPAGRVWVMLITNRRGDWIVPKGMIESNKTPQQSALNEALEEAGILGAIEGPSIGGYSYLKYDVPCRVELYAMRVERTLNRWLEQDERERDWFT
ncbi:MAG: NUDIX hydrolase, partial [Hyphomonadaceae bacterium]